MDAALAILRQKGDELPRASDGTPSILRIGIHFGPTQVESDIDRQSDVVNMAFRLEGAGVPGFHETHDGILKDTWPLRDRIFLSEHAHEELRRIGKHAIRLAGFFGLKGIAGRCRVYEVQWQEVPVAKDNPSTQTMGKKTD